MRTAEQAMEQTRVEVGHTATPWDWWTSNSHMRLTGANGIDGGVISASIASDGKAVINIKHEDAAFIKLAVNSHEALVKALQFMIAYENDDEFAIDEIQEAFNCQESVKDVQEFARCYCARKMSAALLAAGVQA